MAATLVGAVGAASQGAAAAAVTPAWGAGASRTAGNLLIASVAVTGVATLPATPAGWTLGANRLGTSCAAAVYWKLATGADAAPTFAAVTGGQIAAQLQEWSGMHQTQPYERGATNAALTTPIVATNSAVDATSGSVVIGVGAAAYNNAATKTTSHTMNNGATDTEVSNDATSSIAHYNFSRGVTTGNASAQTDSFAFTATQVKGAVIVVNTFKVADFTAPTVAVSSTSLAKLSSQATKNQDDVIYQVNEACQAWELRIVAAEATTRAAAGAVIKSGGAQAANTNLTVSVTDADLTAAGIVDGQTVRLKIFAQDLAGNWS